MTEGSHVCRRAEIHVCVFVFVLEQCDIEGRILNKFQTNPPSGLVGDALNNKCLQTNGKTDGRTDEWTNRYRRERSHKSSSSSQKSYSSGALCEAIIHTLRIELLW